MKLDVNVPTSLRDIKLRDYQQFVKIQADKEMHDIFIRQKMVQIFCNIPLLTVTKMKRKDFMSISNSLIEVISEKPKHTEITELNGVRYGFIPDLDNALSLGEFVDLGSYMEKWDDFHKAMSVMYRPITIQRGKKYLIEDYTTKAELYKNKDLQGLERLESRDGYMMDMTMDVVMGAVVFFWTLGSTLLKITPRYLQAHLREHPKAAEYLEKNGVGISTFTSSLEEACLKLEMLLPYTLVRH